MKWYKHLFIYLGCIAFNELIIAGLFLLEQLSGHNIWYMFAWLQLAVPFVTLVLPFLMVEALISADNERKAQAQLYAEVYKMLEKYDIEEYKKTVETALKDYKRRQQTNNDLLMNVYQTNIDLLRTVHKTNTQNQNKLKALEIIKENLVVSYDESENDKPCLILSIKTDKDNLVVVYETFDKEKIDLLKEVLL